METISLLHKSREKEFKTTLLPEVSKRISHVDFDDVNKLEFVSRVSLKSMLWAIAFFIFFLDLCLNRNPDNWFFSSIAAMSVGFGILALILADRQYYILLHLNDGSRTKVEITKKDRKNAEEFVAIVNRGL
jgi:hypothetical protein